MQKIRQEEFEIEKLEEEKKCVNEEIRNKRKRIEEEYMNKKQKMDNLKAEVDLLKKKNLALDVAVEKVYYLLLGFTDNLYIMLKTV